MSESSLPLTPSEELQLQANAALVRNAAERTLLAWRLGLDGSTHNGKRDLYTIFGYKSGLGYAEFHAKYSRQDIAGRIATAYPDATWSNPPEVIDDEDSQDETQFEIAFKELCKKLRLWHYLFRVDVLSQLGRYAVLMIGIDGGSKPDVARPAGSKVAYLMPYGENSAAIKTFVIDPVNPRFGKPEMYNLSLVDVAATINPSTGQTVVSSGKTIEVHHSRTLHVAENLLDNEVYGMSILHNIYNRLDDLEKVVGGCAEVYWLNARQGLNLNVDKDTTIADPDKLTQAAEDYANQLTRILKTKGMDVKVLEGRTDSPKDQVDAILMLISGATGIPKRILTGSEAGELASSQDEDNWLSRVNDRRVNYCEASMIRPLVDLLIETGDLPAPKDGKYQVKWPELVSLSAEKQAEIAVKKAGAIATYVNAMGSDLLVTPQQFVEEVLMMEYREDEIAVLEEEQAQQEEEDRKAMEKQGLDPITGKPKAPVKLEVKTPNQKSSK